MLTPTMFVRKNIALLLSYLPEKYCTARESGGKLGNHFPAGFLANEGQFVRTLSMSNAR